MIFTQGPARTPSAFGDANWLWYNLRSSAIVRFVQGGVVRKRRVERGTNKVVFVFVLRLYCHSERADVQIHLAFFFHGLAFMIFERFVSLFNFVFSCWIAIRVSRLHCAIRKLSVSTSMIFE